MGVGRGACTALTAFPIGYHSVYLENIQVMTGNNITFVQPSNLIQ
jgi:hypothetical protein